MFAAQLDDLNAIPEPTRFLDLHTGGVEGAEMHMLSLTELQPLILVFCFLIIGYAGPKEFSLLTLNPFNKQTNNKTKHKNKTNSYEGILKLSSIRMLIRSPGSHVMQAGLELLILLPPPST